MATAAPLYTTVDAPLIKAEVDKFLSCIKALGGGYKIMVEQDGTMVVSPIDRRIIDFGATDQELYKCVKEAIRSLKVVTESSLYPDQKDTESMDLALVDYEYLAGKDAMGQGFEPINQSGTAQTDMEQMEKSAEKCACCGPPCSTATYFYFYEDVYTGCNNLNVKTYNLNNCYSYASSFASINART